MSAIGSIGVTGVSTQAQRCRREPPEAQRALVPLEPAGRAHIRRPRPGNASSSRPFAPYLAHLIATAEGVPQTRERRRLDPQEAAGHYRTAASHLATRPAFLKAL